MLYGYGGFNVSLTPAYTAQALAWVEAGGVWAVANLRGGCEYGEEWHRAGMRERKQNVFDDFAAAGEHLVAEGWTTHEQLAVMGGSNGGLLVGAALTQRPDLAAAVVCSVPLLDMVRYELFGLGRTWNDEYGTADDPIELGWLLGYSPYHAVREGTAYPAVLFTTFESDTRVDPLHARKLAAALQHATSAEAPIVLRRETSSGTAPARSAGRWGWPPTSWPSSPNTPGSLAVGHDGPSLTERLAPGRLSGDDSITARVAGRWRRRRGTELRRGPHDALREGLRLVRPGLAGRERATR